MYKKLKDADGDRNLRTAGGFVDAAIKQLRRKGVSFLGGDAGPLAVGAVVYQSLGRAAESHDCLDRSAVSLNTAFLNVNVSYTSEL